MKIVLDMQSRQTIGSRERGIGRYSLSLAKAMLEIGGRHDFVIIANEALGMVNALRNDFGLPEQCDEFKSFSSMNGTASSASENIWRRKASEIVRETFLAGLGADAVHTTSMFEGYGDDACVSISEGRSSLIQAVTLYDLIPYAHPEVYLAHPAISRWYYERLGHLRRADLLLSISAFSSEEAISRLGLSRDCVVNISGAADPHFVRLEMDEGGRRVLAERYGLSRYIMYTGGIDFRKNIERLIEAYALLPRELTDEYQLAIVCKVQPEEKRRLEQLATSHGLAADRLVMTGFVPEDDLVKLYNACELFVFPSWCEGFGLPALEAMQCGAAVIASAASSLPEVVGREDALFDPYDIGAMSSKIQEVLENPRMRDDLSSHGLQRSTEFSWQRSARLALDALEQQHEQRKASARVLASVPAIPDSRPRLAFVSPLPPDRSGIAQYSAELLPFLAKYYRITLIVPSGWTDDSYLAANFPIHDVDWLLKHGMEFDRVLYQFGNSTFHQHMFGLLEKLPGAVVLHDFWLSGIVAYQQLTGQSPGYWDEELHYSHGWKALLEKQREGDEAARARYPASRRVVDAASGVIVHSEKSLQMLMDWYGARARAKAVHIPHLRVIPAVLDDVGARQQLGYAPGTRLLCSFGFLDETKYSVEIIEAFMASCLADDPSVRLVMVGENPRTPYGDEVKKLVDQAGGKVSVTGFVEQEEYALYLQAAEAAVQLRRGTRGETSGAALDCLANGAALLINRNEAFGGIPAEAVFTLREGFGQDELISAMEHAMTRSPERAACMDIGASHLREQAHPAAIAAKYFHAIEEFQHASSRLQAARACGALVDMDTQVAPSNADLLSAATAIRRNNLPSSTALWMCIDIALVPDADIRELVETPHEWKGSPLLTELVHNDASGLIRAREAVSSAVELSNPLPDTRLEYAAALHCLLDLSAISGRVGDPANLQGLVQAADKSAGFVWFSASDASTIAALRSASKIAAGFLAEDKGVADRLVERLEGIIDPDCVEVKVLFPSNALASGTYHRWATSAVLSTDRTKQDGTGYRIACHSGAHRLWPADHQALHTEVGELCHDTLRSRGRSGFLVFGPYVHISPGTYRLRIYGTLPTEPSPLAAWYDVTAEHGQTTILKAVPLIAGRGEVVVDREVILERPAEDIEIRIWVGEGEIVTITAIQLTTL